MTGKELQDQVLVICAIAAAAFVDKGVAVNPQMTDEGMTFQDPSGKFVLNLNNLIGECLVSEPAQMRPIIQGWVKNAVDFITAHQQAENEFSSPLTLAELRNSLYTRLIADDDDPEFSYAHRLAPGLALVLSQDTPTAVGNITAERIAELDLPLDDLYRIAQHNTDSAPISSIEHIEKFALTANGDSWFIAAKIGNMKQLCADLGISGEKGLLVAPVNRHSVLYAVPEPADSISQLIAITNLANLATGGNNPGDIVPYAYLWTPDGHFERVGGLQMEIDGKPATLVSPGPGFNKYVGT